MITIVKHKFIKNLKNKKNIILASRRLELFRDVLFFQYMTTVMAS
jgi:hypothetical protein